MSISPKQPVRYPLLEALLHEKGLSLRGIYSIRDTATIFGVSKRTIQERVRIGKLAVRDLPGRDRFLSEDLEMFLKQSQKAQCLRITDRSVATVPTSE